MDKKILGVLLVVVMCLAVAVQVTAQPIAFVINGYVTVNGEPCDNPCVEIINLDTGMSWYAKNYSGTNYYQLVLESSDVCVGTHLQITISGCGQPQMLEHTVTQEEIDTGGFMTSISPQAYEFDTGSGTYPSISGTHYGTILPEQNITVNRIYTYPCAGTGGHTEYVKLWNETTGECAVTKWDGYNEEYNDLTFNTTLTLRKGVVYSYIIKTGSYPQLIHASYKQLDSGNITCTRFEDANRKEHEDCIPAFRLWYTPTIYVPGDYDTIQAAINQSSVGDTIIVYPKGDTNVYNEHLEISENLHYLKLIAKGTVVIKHESGDQITVNGEGCTIQGFNITAGGSDNTYPNWPDGAGIRLRSSNNIIKENYIYGTAKGIVSDSTSSYNTFMNNKITYCFCGLHIGGDYNLIADTTFRGCYEGYQLEDTASQNTIRGNMFTKQATLNGSDNLIYNNMFLGSISHDITLGSENIYNITKTHGTNILGGPYLGGNYWHDYTGNDSDGDGIGDIPFHGDQLPLVELNGGDAMIETLHHNYCDIRSYNQGVA